MKWIIAALAAVCVLAPGAHCAADTVAWCYHLPTCNDTTWPTIATQFCNGSRQSPINIVTSAATGDSNLGAFTFTQYDNTSVFNKIENTGKTIKVTFHPGVQVSGGDLPETYDSLQFHLHWGNGTSHPGSEHTVDGKRYAMELHIVNSRSSFNRNTTLAIANSTGLAALGFFIEGDNSTNTPVSWQTLTSHLQNITLQGQTVSITGISLDDLIGSVDRTRYYRYLGSLTTPNCNEAVVWTVFKDPIHVSSNLIDLFSTLLHINTTDSSPLMTNVFRNVQADLPVTTQVEGTASSSSRACYSLGLMLLSLLLLGRS